MTSSVGSTSSTNSSSISNSLASSASQLNSDYSSFLTLLTTQLQNQDPLSPMDSNTFTQQLVAMNGVQQQLLTNNLLEQLVTNSTGAGAIGSAVSLIGKTVTAQASTATLNNGSASWTYNLASSASTVNLQVLDSNGNVVWAGQGSGTAAGNNTFTWNGVTDTGSTDTTGTYTLKVSATDSGGNAITSTNSVTGVVTGVQNSGGVTQLNIGGNLVNYSSITSVQSN